MSSIAPHIEAFLREHLAHHRGASQHTCDSYAYSFQSLFEFAAHKLKAAPSALMLEQLDATLISAFLEHLGKRLLSTVLTESVGPSSASYWSSVASTRYRSANTAVQRQTNEGAQKMEA
jgi:site-specific recombinase XerC